MKRLPIPLTILVLSVFFMVGHAQPAPAPSAVQKPAKTEIIKLKYADQNPNFGWTARNAAHPWLMQIEEATKGKVKVEEYYSQTLIKGADAWQATKAGVADIAWCFHGYWANMTPLSDVITLPFLPFVSAEQASGILWQLYEKFPSIFKEYKDNHILLLWTTTPHFLMNSKREVKTLEDFKGLKIRVVGGPPTEIMKLLGAVPVMMGMPDTLMGLEKRVIDGIAQNWNALIDFRQYEVAKYYTYAPFFTTYFSQAMNLNTWNSLPPDVQKQIESVSGLQGSKFWGKNMFDSAGKEGRELIKKEGYPMVEYTPPPDELNKWIQIAKPLWEAWVKKMETAGHPEAREILDTTLNLIKTYKP